MSDKLRELSKIADRVDTMKSTPIDYPHVNLVKAIKEAKRRNDEIMRDKWNNSDKSFFEIEEDYVFNSI